MAETTREYSIYAGVGKSDEDVELVDVAEFDNEVEALNYARECAVSIYNLDPVNDMFEIMDRDNVDEETAYRTFLEEAEERIVYFVTSTYVDERGNIVPVRYY